MEVRIVYRENDQVAAPWLRLPGIERPPAIRLRIILKAPMALEPDGVFGQCLDALSDLLYRGSSGIGEPASGLV